MTNMDYAKYYVEHCLDLPTRDKMDRIFDRLPNPPERYEYKTIEAIIYALLDMSLS